MIAADLEGCEQAFAALGRPCRVLAVTGSTNDDARGWAAEGAPSGAVVIADAQRAGKGRHGRSWSSPPGESLAISFILRPTLAPAALPPLAIAAGLAVLRAVGRRTSATVQLKWPNDVLVSGNKIAGILVEGAVTGRAVDHAVVGIGINVRRTAFPDDLAARATSLALAGCSEPEALHRGRLALDLARLLDEEVDELLRTPGRLPERVAPHDALRGRAVRLEAGEHGVASGLDGEGRLSVQLPDGRKVAAVAGEITLIEGPP